MFIERNSTEKSIWEDVIIGIIIVVPAFLDYNLGHGQVKDPIFTV